MYEQNPTRKRCRAAAEFEADSPAERMTTDVPSGDCLKKRLLQYSSTKLTAVTDAGLSLITYCNKRGTKDVFTSAKGVVPMLISARKL